VSDNGRDDVSCDEVQSFPSGNLVPNLTTYLYGAPSGGWHHLRPPVTTTWIFFLLASCISHKQCQLNKACVT